MNVMAVDEGSGLLAYGTTDGAMVIRSVAQDAELLRMGDERVPSFRFRYRRIKPKSPLVMSKGS